MPCEDYEIAYRECLADNTRLAGEKKALIERLASLVEQQLRDADKTGSYGAGICDPTVAQTIRHCAYKVKQVIDEAKSTTP